MATDLELLQTARTALLTALSENAGCPNYTIENQTVSIGELFDRLAKIDAAIAALNGPVELITEGHV